VLAVFFIITERKGFVSTLYLAAYKKRTADFLLKTGGFGVIAA
jgi:hypothetical protein